MSERGEADYIHGTSPTEQARLSLLNSLLNESCLRELKLQGTERIIDFGCGLAQFTRRMARRVRSGGKAVGIERDSKQLADGQRQAGSNRSLPRSPFPKARSKTTSPKTKRTLGLEHSEQGQVLAHAFCCSPAECWKGLSAPSLSVAVRSWRVSSLDRETSSIASVRELSQAPSPLRFAGGTV
jgi:SAM-dependent methyltransferase